MIPQYVVEPTPKCCVILFPRTEAVKETLGWLDRYLGKVRGGTEIEPERRQRKCYALSQRLIQMGKAGQPGPVGASTRRRVHT